MANRDTTQGRYVAQRDDYPSQSEFGNAEYVDATGRQYRLAYCSRLTGWAPGQKVPSLSVLAQQSFLTARAVQGLGNQVRLWVKLPTRRGVDARDTWFTHEEIMRQAPLDLMPVVAGLPRQQCRLRQVSRHVRGRTGSIMVSGFVL